MGEITPEMVRFGISTAVECKSRISDIVHYISHDSHLASTAGRTSNTMSTQLHLAYGIVEGRAHSDVDQALLRTVELARSEQRRAARAARRNAR